MSRIRALRAELRASWRLMLREVSAFGIVGFINLGLDVGLFNLLNSATGKPLTSKILATTVSATTAYFMHRHWSFAHRARTGVKREYVLFFFFNGIALAMGLLIIALVRYGLHRSDLFALNLANLTGIVVGTMFRFWAYKRWVFLAVGAPDAAPEEETQALGHS